MCVCESVSGGVPVCAGACEGQVLDSLLEQESRV